MLEYITVLFIVVVAAFLYLLYRKRSKGKGRGTEKDALFPSCLDSLALGLAHEIRNPLSILSVNLQLLEEEISDTANGRGETVRMRVQGLKREVQRLDDVVSDFLRFARDERPRFVEQDVNKVVDEVVDFVAPEARKNDIEVDRRYESGLPPVRLDINLFKQALLNMIINAQQAMPGGGKLLVRTAYKDGQVQIEIADTGTGIRDAEFKKIFEVYYSTRENGTGLGLPTVKRIVEGHGGTISVESEQGKGSNFIVRLPLGR
ncbi:MAG: two-component system sensor histidine kinase NtrB [Candidatus Bathyanammoxibius sp.]